MPWAGAGCSGPEKWGVRALCVPWTACSLWHAPDETKCPQAAFSMPVCHV